MIPLAIGTAQFGQKYGICNSEDAVEGDAARRIVALALEGGIDYFDTAKLYGNSESELGAALPPNKAVKIITKLAADPAAPEKICTDFEDSLRCLGCEQVYAVLIHNAQSLLGLQGIEIWKKLELLKSKGLTQKIGISIYTPEEFSEISDAYRPDIVQVPCNLLDQRFLRKDIQEMKKGMEIEFHARSLFLQGVLVNLPDSIPPFMSHGKELFDRIYNAACNSGMTMLDFCLAFAASCKDQEKIDRWVIGVDSSAQLADITKHAAIAASMTMDWSQFGTNASDIIDPRQWKRTIS